MKDSKIIEFLEEGKYESAFNVIVDTYSERLYWHVRRFMDNHDDANDLVQEVFIKIWNSLPNFRGDSQIFTWIYRIATNEALNKINKDKNRSTLKDAQLETLVSSKIEDDPYFNGTALQRELHKAVSKLPEKQRTVFNLRYFDEMKYEDMSKVTGTSVGALKASYHHAYNKIKEKLEKIFIH
jgi:RNA polymerase sigma-70 factor (ECF subfamily)